MTFDKALAVEGTANLNIMTDNGVRVAVPVDIMPGGAELAAPRIVWRSDGTGDAVTWAQVMTKLATLGPGVEIYCNQFLDTLAIPAGAYELDAATFFAPPGHALSVNVADGVTINECGGMVGPFQFTFNSSSGENVLTFNEQQTAIGLWVFKLAQGVQFQNAGTNPIATVTTSAAVFLLDGSSVGFSSESPCFAVKDGSTLELVVIDNGSSSNIANDAVGGTGILNIEQDGSLSVPPPTFSAVGVTLTQSALGLDAGGGPSTFRPSGASLKPGTRYYDTDRQQTLFWWDVGSAWRPMAPRLLATGTTTGVAAGATVAEGPYDLFPGESPSVQVYGVSDTGTPIDCTWAEGGGTQTVTWVLQRLIADPEDQFRVVFKNNGPRATTRWIWAVYATAFGEP